VVRRCLYDESPQDALGDERRASSTSLVRVLSSFPTGLRDERELSIWTRLGCGAAAGSVGQTVAYPFDVARRRLQVRTQRQRSS
jgi:hypothetical protein